MNLSPALLNAIEKYLAGESGPEEEQMVNTWYHSFDDRQVDIPEPIRRLREKVGARIWHRLMLTINQTEASNTSGDRKSFLNWRWIMTTAAAILLLFVGGRYFLSQTKEKKIVSAAKPEVKNIAPGGNRAVLTLANGFRILLDSARNGLLASQGATRISKLNSGKLVYKVSARAALEPVSYNVISTPRGGQFQVSLPDGTNVWLNAATTLRYPTRFEGLRRTVQLSGEAYFEVAKNAGAAFIVDMPDHQNGDSLHIQVLGTSFNVNGYEDEGTVKTTLVTGMVKVTRKTVSREMSPGEQTQTESSGGFKTLRHADIEEALAWKNGLFKYSSTNLQVIMRQIARWYDVDISYVGKASDEFFSGSVPRSDSVSSILHKLALTNTVRFTIQEKTIRVARIE